MADPDAPAEQRPDGEPRDEDLRGADLRRRDLTGRDLRGADLRGADLRDACLAEVRASGARLSGARLRRCSLAGADLSGARLDGADLVEADLREANLAGVDLTGAILDFARLEGADLAGARLGRLTLRRVDLRRANLAGADLAGVQLVDGELARTDLTGANLTGAILSFADLRGAVLCGATLDDADLSGAQLEGADLREASVRRTRMAWVQGLDAEARRGLRERGARVPIGWLARRWARLNAVARRHTAALYVGSMALLAALSLATAYWAGERTGQDRLYELHAPGEGVIFEVDCGAASDRPYDGKVGHVGGARGRGSTEGIQRVKLAPTRAYGTDRRGAEFAYKFHLSPGWYELQLHFAELEQHRRGARTFDIRIEGELVVQDFDILAQTYPQTVLVRRWGVWVDDGVLDVHFLRKHVKTPAKLNFARVRRLDSPPDWRREPGDQ